MMVFLIFGCICQGAAAFLVRPLPLHPTKKLSPTIFTSPSSGLVPCRYSPLYAKIRSSKDKESQPRKAYRLGGEPFLPHKNLNASEPETILLDGQEQSTVQLNVTELTNSTENLTLNETAIPLTAGASVSKNETTTKSEKTVLKTTTPNSFFSTWPINAAQDITKAKASGAKVRIATNMPEKVSPLVSGKKQDEFLTLADLQVILRTNGYVRQSDLQMSDNQASLVSQLATTKSSSKTKSGGIAMPQISVLSYRDLTIGSTISAGFLGMILGTTIFPNLWLIGMVFGAMYGYDISKNYKEKPPTNVLPNLIVGTGRRLAKAYLLVYDAVKGIWFMYKTGQLSYEYYKQYSKLDQRFAINDKIDAWNARFQEGKLKFDQWEKENEISRRLLAGMRTVWLVEERSLKKGRKSGLSRYRVVQLFYDMTGWCRRFAIGIWNTVTGGGSSELREVMRGIRINVSESRMQEIGPRIGAAMIALLAVSMVGAMYAIAPHLLGLVAVVTGLVWPTWVPEMYDRLSLLMDELRAKGRGEDIVMGNSGLSFGFGRSEKNRYYFYKRDDGSKRWYRTGRPAFRSDEPKAKDDWWATISNNDKKKKKKPDKENRRGLFSW